MFVSCPPKWAPSDIAKILKGVSARLLLQEFPELKRRGHLWTNAYYVGSAGNISADVIGRYIEGQRRAQVFVVSESAPGRRTVWLRGGNRWCSTQAVSLVNGMAP